MSERIHDDEPDVSEAVVRTLLGAECAQWAHAPLHYLRTSGTDNAMWRVVLEDEIDVVVRLPRRAGAAAGVRNETAVLQQLSGVTLPPGVLTPLVRHVGEANDTFPHRWSVLQWIDGDDAWTRRADLDDRRLMELADDLARTVVAIGQLTIDELRPRPDGARGGSLGPLIARLEEWLTDDESSASSLIDVDAVRRCAAEAREVIDEPVTAGFVHGDLIPGNLLLHEGRLHAVLDWGGAGHGDLAQDLGPAWAVFDGPSREVFRRAVDVDEAAWIRARAFELEHAVGGVLYYRPKGHPLGDVMARTLERILSSSSA